MITVTAAEFQRHFGRYQDEALTQPVAITRNGRERLVMMSVDEYRELNRFVWPGPDLRPLSSADCDLIDVRLRLMNPNSQFAHLAASPSSLCARCPALSISH